MDLDKQQLQVQNHDIVDAEEDRISELPDSLLHYILSFLQTNYVDELKCVARTSVLSKRWHHVWTSIPTLVFPSRSLGYPKPTPLSEINKLINFVDRTLLLRDPTSSIQKVSLTTNRHMNVSQVHSWISSLIKRNVQELSLHLLDLSEPFCIPRSLFTCESLTELALLSSASCTINVPKNFSFPKLQTLTHFSFPKLKTLTLSGIQFADDTCWDAQHFSNCPVLENLNLYNCTWSEPSDARNFCISIPALKFLRIKAFRYIGLQDCALKINAPNLVSLTYQGRVPKEYVFSSFQRLESSEVYFDKYYARARIEQRSSYCAAASKFFRAISLIQSLEIDAGSLEVLSDANNLPTFHNLNELDLIIGPASDKVIFALLKAAPNLKNLQFNDGTLSSIDDEEEYGETEGLFGHLQAVNFNSYTREARELRWAKFILKNAKSLQTMTIGCYRFDAKAKEKLMTEIVSLPRASERCVFKFV